MFLHELFIIKVRPLSFPEFAQNPSLKLILKVGSSSTPEYGTDSPSGHGICENSSGSVYYSTSTPGEYSSERKKAKKKKRKKDREGREKKHKSHKEKRHRHRHRDESSQEFPVLSPEDLEENMLHFGELKTIDCLAARPVTRPMVPLTISPKSMMSGNESDSQPLLSPTGSVPGGSAGGRGSLDKAGSESGREPRTCVLKLKASQTPLGKVLDHVLRSLEKRDPQQYFAWPVTDDIAPGYSSIITKAMDFNTMRQNIEENKYDTMHDFSNDFRLMCDNAMRYNHGETVYHKAAKKLLQVGNKMLQPEALVRSLRPMMATLKTLTEKELGFDLAVAVGGEHPHQQHQAHHHMQDSVSHLDSADEDEGGNVTARVGGLSTEDPAAEEESKHPVPVTAPLPAAPPEPERSEEEEILLQVQRASEKLARERQLRRKRIAKIGFLRQNKDGTTSMQILVDVDGVCGSEKLISLGDFTGKLKSGTGTLNSAREDARNVARLVKPIDYGAFSSFAPVFDSRFANLSKEETQLVNSTYGGEGEVGVEYADSLTKFTQGSEFASTLANGILDVLTHGEHSKVMGELMAEHQPQYEQREVDRHLPAEEEKSMYGDVKVDYDSVRSLSDIGIDTAFIDDWIEVERCVEWQQQLAGKLSANAVKLSELNTVQSERLSQPLPQHLQMVTKAQPEEVSLAHQITSNLVEMAKTLTPEAIATAPAIRKAMGVSCGEWRWWGNSRWKN